MKFGHYSDNELPLGTTCHHDTNSQGYRCPEFSPLPDGGKNVAVLGCSHTFGEGLEREEIWVSHLEKKLLRNHLRFWNLGQPGASADKCVRILYGAEKVIFPKIIIVCWPSWSRRERLEDQPISITSDDDLLKTENEATDRNNFLKCVFQIEKFSNYNGASTFHCFAQDIYQIPNLKRVLATTSLAKCWPVWHKTKNRNIITVPSLARDNLHYGVEHHEQFAEEIYNVFGSKLK